MDLIKREVVASQGVIVSNNPLASLAGAEMYAIGGNAFDAAVASLFALTVVEPFMVSVFGAGFFVIRSDEKQCVETLDNYAMAPLKASSTMFEMVERRKPGQDIFETVGRKNLHGPLSVATPGTLKAWEYINQKYGSLPLEKVIAPAIRYAYMGYTSSPLMQWISDYYREDLIKYPETSKIFLPGGKPVPPGTLIKMPNYGETLEKIASEGSNSLYNGDIGKQVVEYLGESEGILSMEDLNRYKLVEREPVMCTYRDIYEIYSMAPGSSGGTHIIQMLNILENYDIAGMGFPSAKYLHVLAEVMKIAFSDRQKYMGDPM
jgi:gamma-glutamyltranspeptidase/glutathione hydrolase